MAETRASFGSLTPRTRFEVDTPRAQTSRRPIPLVQLTTSYQTILTARDDADFMLSQIYAAEVSGAAVTIDVSLVPPAGSASSANAIAFGYAIAANTVEPIIGASEMMVPPGYTVQAKASANTAINVFGWGSDLTASATE